MARRLDTPCAGGCGAYIWTPGKQNASRPMCRPCRYGAGYRIEPPECTQCGNPCARGRKTCSEACQRAGYQAGGATSGSLPKKTKGPRKPCEICGTPIRLRHRTCSPKCTAARRNQRAADYRAWMAELAAAAASETPTESDHADDQLILDEPAGDTCRVRGCDRTVNVRRHGVCRPCYQRIRYRDPDLFDPRCARCASALPNKDLRTSARYCEPCKARDQGQSGASQRKLSRSLGRIAARDDYCCKLCETPVDMALTVPAPGAPTIDHIIPRSRGGTDDEDNLQLAHFLCNVKKGNRISALLIKPPPAHRPADTYRPATAHRGPATADAARWVAKALALREKRTNGG